MIDTLSILGKEISLYYLSWFLGMLGCLAYGFWGRKEYGVSVSRCIIYVSLDLIVGYLMIWATSWVFGGGEIKGFNFVRIINFFPLYYIVVAIIFKDSVLKISDYLAPIGGLIFGITHFGCFFEGCCHGFPSKFGFYSNVAKTVCFPIQLIEAIVGLIIGFVLIFMGKRKIQQGCLYPWYMVMYGGTRFIFEFFRDNEKLFYNISELSLHALASFIIGVVTIFIINAKRKKGQGN